MIEVLRIKRAMNYEGDAVRKARGPEGQATVNDTICVRTAISSLSRGKEAT